jgi:mannonate dehydratase
MRQGWRWYGPNDPVSLDDVRQAGASDIVTALHHVPIGEAWTLSEVEQRKREIEAGPRSKLTWSVVESIPIADDVRRVGARATRSIDAWIASMEALAEADIKIICYNFMPVVDWCRTELEWDRPNGAKALRFDQPRYLAFELHVLKRPGVENEFSDAEKAIAKQTYEALSEADKETLVSAIVRGLPGTTNEALSLDAFRERLAGYADVDASALRGNLIQFLDRVAPRAEELGVRLTLHPDDPPRPLFGLPRIASTADDYRAIFSAVPSKANGVCFCTGSFGVRADNDLPAMVREFAPRIGFAHLRATTREPDGSFYEADHLDGDVDMVSVVRELLTENRKRAAHDTIVFRPDHGHRMLDDLSPSKRTNPGYTAIGRLRGLAELRGVMRALEGVV